MKEIFNFKVSKYRDDKGNHVCAYDFQKGEFWLFLRNSHYGTREYCSFDEQNMLERKGEDGLGYLIPCDNCPLKDKP